MYEGLNFPTCSNVLGIVYVSNYISSSEYVVIASVQFSSIQSLSCVLLFATPWTAACQGSLSITNSRSSLKPMSIKSVMPSSHLILCRPLLLLLSIFSSTRVFSNESALRIRWPKYWSFSFNISPSNEHPGLISFRMDWLDLLAVQGTLKSLILNCKCGVIQSFPVIYYAKPGSPKSRDLIQPQNLGRVSLGNFLAPCGTYWDHSVVFS